MKIFNLVVFLLFRVAGMAQSPADYPIKPVSFTQVHVHDEFWAPKIRLNASVTIPYTLEQCRKTGRIDNFLKAAGLKEDHKLTQFTFDDTDLYKVIEGASYGLQVKKDPELDRYLDTLIGYIAAAQEPDGYLFTFRTAKTDKPHEWIGNERWEKVSDLSHELYNSGHLFEAAAAHYQATGKDNLLNIAIKNADMLVNTFGRGKVEKYPGHQVVEIGLAKMYRVTGKKEYLDLAKFFLDIRGPQGTEYSQSHKKVTEQQQAVGHAVRAAYMYTGMADIAALTGDKSYINAIDNIWNDVVHTKLYITGGIGATGAGEAFGKPYDLPNMSAYAETCGSIANVYWNNRMFLLKGDSRYIDVLEKILYNGLLSGISISGDRFFYPNPLASMGQHARSPWFSCACCVSNMTRFLPSVPGYVYAQNENDLYVNLFMSNESNIRLPAGNIKILQKTEYPWKGDIELAIDPEKDGSQFTLNIRVPGWATGQAIPGDLYHFTSGSGNEVTLWLNGKQVQIDLKKGYAVLNRKWKQGDKVQLRLPMEVNKVYANKNVKEDQGRFAVQRGPIMYCLEGADNKDSMVHNILIPDSTTFTPVYEKSLLGGVVVLNAAGTGTKRQNDTEALEYSNQPVKAIPYYSWANRGAGEMMVWVPYESYAVRPKPAPTVASKSKISSSLNNPRQHRAVNDQLEPSSSGDHAANYMHWWPKKNTTEWIRYDFDREYSVSSSSVYWFDDGPWGGCRIPKGWKIYYKKGDEWIAVKSLNDYPVQKDIYNTIQFEPVKTTALKLEIQLPENFATGIHEWIVK